MKKEFIVNINKIKSKYDCKGELIFRSALCLLLDYGKERCGNVDWVNDNKELTHQNHKEAEEQGKHLLVSERLENAIIDCAYELAQFGNWELMEYIQTEIQTDWQTPTYKQLGEQIKYLCTIIKSYNGNNVSEILYEWSINQEVLEYLELNEYLKEEE